MNDHRDGRRGFVPRHHRARPSNGRKGVRPNTQPPARERDGFQRIYGHHSVLEALRNPTRRHHRLLATENAARKIADSLAALPIEPTLVRPEDIGRQVPPDAVHQGVLLITHPLDEPDLRNLPPDALVVVLDQVTDPHNVGAILRTAAAFGVNAMVTTERHSPEITGVLAKAASGALEHVPLIHVRNLGEALMDLGELGFLRIGLDSASESALDQIVARRPLALVLGAEGKGLRQRTRGLCDHLARITLPGAIKSLNVSNAAAIALFSLTQAR